LANTDNKTRTTRGQNTSHNKQKKTIYVAEAHNKHTQRKPSKRHWTYRAWFSRLLWHLPSKNGMGILF